MQRHQAGYEVDGNWVVGHLLSAMSPDQLADEKVGDLDQRIKKVVPPGSIDRVDRDHNYHSETARGLSLDAPIDDPLPGSVIISVSFDVDDAPPARRPASWSPRALPRNDGLVDGVPTFVTHYHRARRAPFLNLSDLAADELTNVLTQLTGPDEQALSARRFGARYMALRRATETRLRQLFIRAGGEPERAAPHYFVLGTCAWFEGLYRDVAEVRLPLSALPSQVTSLTYADSVTALGLGVTYGLPAPDPNHADRVYRLEDLESLVRRFGLPHDAAPTAPAGYAGHQHQRIDTYVEVQLWSDEPIRHIAEPESLAAAR